ncbi:dipeptide/oligopeptide/nickel ABC transporter permease/ATP-binding protein [Buchananella hordeovulneris]|uniref:ABC transporter n=1 Tax=Buchananella hordeovulneris TaxID=52770 RepID=A0A1Q5PX04_9ACTO|nr:dipeptide/oligopeptide/nickel ABC transporter permease/ATP-binding protein [Buchananella hordeovulneris]MDO5080519.1 dipeptide/oligopeptide/nickel ABC transporter permease/ATP-binding protein [Buchananella hordeovulneris]OKL51920.1 ABC transporter [Buchananella hordeovulneris]RRD51805.1 dipeptide/oligopeptide/nickel ABC transporter permease/ATP-binding protein [Buchananella hordeovulneris]
MRKNKIDKAARPGVRVNRWAAMSLGARIATLLLGAIFLASLIGPFLTSISPTSTEFGKWLAPSGSNWFGTDQFSRDIFTRVLHGGRYSLGIGLAATAIALVLGAIIGSIAAVVRKWLSEFIMRLMDVMMSVPGIALAAVSVLAFQNPESRLQMTIVITCAIAAVYVPQLTRIVRANVLAAYGEDYVNAVVVSGARAPWILIKHVARNTAAPVLVFATVLVADAIILEASLNFIGAGFNEGDVATWGNILSSAQNGLRNGVWWQAVFPGLLIMLTVLCLNILSEGITDAMVAAPKGEVVDAPRADAEREADQLLIDPVKAHAAQAESLQERLDALRAVEERRTDRFVPAAAATPLLEVKDLCIQFPRHGNVNVVDRVSFTVREGETMGLVGESGCGKSITSLAIMGLLDPRAEISGEIRYQGRDLLQMSAQERQALLGHELAMIYQDALSSLNPAMLIRSQMKQLTNRGGTRTAHELLELVGLDPERTLDSYPHELSGGQRQRVLIAMALTRDPKLIIADEPTTALDVTVQKQVIELLNSLRDQLGFAMVFVSHDLALVAEVAHSITVMYAGQVVEQAHTSELLTNPVHEYTRGLLGSVLSIEAGSGRLHQVPGTVPSPRDFPVGDRFAPRSSHPGIGLHQPPVRVQVGEAEHYYAATVNDDGHRLDPFTGQAIKEEQR